VFNPFRIPTPPGKSLKVLFFYQISRPWKVLEHDFGPWKSWKLHLVVLKVLVQKLYTAPLYLWTVWHCINPMLLIIVCAKWTEWMTEILFSFDVCVLSRPFNQTSLKRLKLWTSNYLTCMFPGTVCTWPLKIFSKRRRLKNSPGRDMHSHECLLVEYSSVIINVLSVTTVNFCELISWTFVHIGGSFLCFV